MYRNWNFSSPSSSSPCCFAYFCIFLDLWIWKAHFQQSSPIGKKVLADFLSFSIFHHIIVILQLFSEFPYLGSLSIVCIFFFRWDYGTPPPSLLGLVLRMDYSSPTYPKFTTIICCGCDGCIKDEILIGRPMFSISTKPKWVVLILYF